MKETSKLKLTECEEKALKELKDSLLKKFPNVQIILFGSKARGDFTEESDIDLLILIDSPVDGRLEEEINNITYEIELKYGVVFGKLIESKDFWNSSIASAMPIHQNILKEGIVL